MPELPEVETIRRYLTLVLTGRSIIGVIVRVRKCVKQPLMTCFSNLMRNQTIWSVRRKGKHLIFVLSDHYLISHLRMEGKYFLVGPYHKLCYSPHTLLLFRLNNGLNLIYHDTRRFGTFHLISKRTPYQQLLPQVGYEPADVRMTPAYLSSVWQHKRIAVKSALLEQQFIAGIGNIYASEILFASGIAPQTPVNQLTQWQLTKIIRKARLIMAQAINYGGTTIFSFQSQPGVVGGFTAHLKVYGRANQRCVSCGTLIAKIKIQNRGTYFCAFCQKR